MKNLFSIPFLILPIDTSVECELYSNLNFVHFFFKYFGLFSFRKYTIVAFPSESPGIVYLKHHRADSSGWTLTF
jgi:hypothetical protein